MMSSKLLRLLGVFKPKQRAVQLVNSVKQAILNYNLQEAEIALNKLAHLDTKLIKHITDYVLQNLLKQASLSFDPNDFQPGYDLFLQATRSLKLLSHFDIDAKQHLLAIKHALSPVYRDLPADKVLAKIEFSPRDYSIWADQIAHYNKVPKQTVG